MALARQFLSNIRPFVLQLNGAGLADYLQVEQTASQIYFALGNELKTGSYSSDQAVEKLVDSCLPEETDVAEGTGSPWPGFNAFIKEYLEFWRDVDFQNIPLYHELLSSLVTSCSNALANPTYGVMMLGTSVSLTTSLSKLVVMLNRHPHLTRNIRTVVTGEEESKSIVESAADIIQKIFTTCLTDRSSDRFAKPRGKKVAVYIFANLVLKLLFTCKKSRLAVQMLTNISTFGPALALYPASQRVTYLYYLGRFYFDSSHFMRAATTLQEAYMQCPPQCQSHRQLILTYLIAANMMLGRFPSAALLGRPEARTLGPVFLPICAAIRTGNFIQFQQSMASDFLRRKGLFLSMLYRLRTLVWRSFTRRTFLLTYVPPHDPETSKKVPTLELEQLVTTASYVQKLLEGYVPAIPAPRSRPPHINTIFLKAVTNNVPETNSLTSTLVPPPGGARKLAPSQGLIWGNKPVTLEGIEAIVSVLVAQGLLHGFMTHANPRFAIVGTKQKGNNAVLAGWPNVYQTICERLTEEDTDLLEVPAWIKGA